MDVIPDTKGLNSRIGFDRVGGFPRPGGAARSALGWGLMETTSVTIIDAGPRTVARQARVAADAQEIFALLVDPHRHHEVDGSGTVKADVIGPRELQQGDRFRVAMRMFGIPYAITSTVTRLETDRLVEWRHPGGHRWRWELAPTDDGATLVTEVFDYRGAKGAAAYELIKIPERNAEGIAASLGRLQRRFGS